MEIHPELRRWVEENIRIGYDLALIKRKLKERGHNPEIVDHIVTELKRAEREDKFPRYVINWLKFAAEKGEDMWLIKGRLKSQGYNESDIDYLISKHVPKEKKKEKKEPKFKAGKWITLITFIIVIVLIVLLIAKPRGGPGVTTTTFTTTPVTTTVTIKTTPLLALEAEGYEGSYILINQSDGIIMTWDTFSYYKTNLAQGKYRFEFVAKAERGAELEILLGKKDLENLSKNNLLKVIETRAQTETYWLDIKDDFDYGWPHIIVTTDDKFLGVVYVNSSEWDSYYLDTEIESANPNLWLFYLDDYRYRAGNETVSDRNIYLDKINVYSG